MTVGGGIEPSFDFLNFASIQHSILAARIQRPSARVGRIHVDPLACDQMTSSSRHRVPPGCHGEEPSSDLRAECTAEALQSAQTNFEYNAPPTH